MSHIKLLNGCKIHVITLAEALSVLFFAAVVAAANGLNLFFINFPELGAISSDVFARPAGKWAKEPLKLVATPVAGAVIGVAVTQYLPYGIVAILLTTGLCVGLIAAMRSALAPAISAGVFPIVLGIHDWRYPLCVLGSLTVLTGLLLLWRISAPGRELLGDPKPDAVAVQVLESRPHGSWWLPALAGFVAIAAVAAQLSGWRFILFPPLIVMAYEMLGHPATCPWALRPFTFPLLCAGLAGTGVLAVHWLGSTPIASTAVLVVGFAALRILRLRMPPALAVGLIPLVLPHPDARYPLSVFIGTGLLTGWFFAYRTLWVRYRAAAAKAP